MKLNQIEKFINELVYNNNQQILNDVYEIIKKHECKTTLTHKWILVCLNYFDNNCIDELYELYINYESKRLKCSS